MESLKGFSSRWPSYHGCHINSSHFKQERVLLGHNQSMGSTKFAQNLKQILKVDVIHTCKHVAGKSCIHFHSKLENGC